MKISLNWLSNYLDLNNTLTSSESSGRISKDSLKNFVEKLAMRGIEVESVTELSKGFEKVIVALLEERNPHPNADRLSVCKVNTGSEVLQIVCGAQNMKAGDKVALAQTGAVLPEGLKIDKSKIRGVESFGMLCSEVELGLADESDGILILSKDAPVGKNLADYFDRNDIILELSVTPNRGDVLSYLGFTREAAAVLQGSSIKNIELDPSKIPFKEASQFSKEKISVKLQNDSLENPACFQYHARYLEVTVGPSPEWLRKKLESVGLRSISNVVDVTNFVLLEYGIPLHAFDFDKISDGQVIVRLAKKDESIKLLDDTTVKLDERDLVIADSQKPIALAGVMGGFDSEVTANTKVVLLEAAQFSPSLVRATARRYQKQTDAAYRFERQVDPAAIVCAMNRAVSLMQQVCSAKVYKDSVSEFCSSFSSKFSLENRKVDISLSELNQFLGTDLSLEQTQSILSNLYFNTKQKGSGPSSILEVTVPSFRRDVHLKEDIYEEVLRGFGYDKISPQTPVLNFAPHTDSNAEKSQNQFTKVKNILGQRGFHEVVNFAFTSEKNLAKWGGPNFKNAVKIENPISEELTHLKTSLVPGLIENYVLAIHHQQQNVRLFELRPVFFKDLNSPSGVSEHIKLAGVFSGRSYSQSLLARDEAVNFNDAKGIIESLLQALGTRGARWSGLSVDNLTDARVHPTQSASLLVGKFDCGYVARMHPNLQAELKQKDSIYWFELDFEALVSTLKEATKYSAISKFPKVFRDFSLIVPNELTAEKVTQIIAKTGKPLIESSEMIRVVDIFRGDKIDAGHYSLSVSTIIGSSDKTLQEEEIEVLSQKILDNLKAQLNVKLRIQ